ncbi:MAG: VLRF1 family aeRF1-type release factor [Thermoleophilia bacterium]|jgi:hypothetical protein
MDRAIRDRAHREGIAATQIASLHDPDGVLSIYVGVEPGGDSGRRTAADIAVRNGLREMESAAEGWPADRRRLLSRRIEQLSGRLTDLVRSAAEGRGRALFVPLGEGDPLTVTLQVPLPDMVRLSGRAHIAPLIGALDETAPAGLVSVSRNRVRGVDLCWGRAEEVFGGDIEIDTGDWRTKEGPAGRRANPQSAAPQHDLFDRRLELRQAESIAAAAEPLGELAGRLCWDRIVVAGDPRMTTALADALAGGRVPVTEVAGKLDWTSAAALADALGPGVVAQRAEEWAAAIDEAVAATAAGGAGAIGPEAIAPALEAGRVSRVFVDPDALPGDDADGVTAESAESLVRAALDTDAEAIVVRSQVLAARLHPHGGAVASLRW